MHRKNTRTSTLPIIVQLLVVYSFGCVQHSVIHIVCHPICIISQCTVYIVVAVSSTPFHRGC